MTTSYDLANALYSHVLRGVSYPMPVTTYVALHTGDPTRVTATALANEVSGGGYTRLQIQRSQWGAPSNGIGNPTFDLVWPTASAPWGTVTHLSLWDGQTGGATTPMMLAKAALAASHNIIAGAQFTIAASQLTGVFL